MDEVTFAFLKGWAFALVLVSVTATIFILSIVGAARFSKKICG